MTGRSKQKSESTSSTITLNKKAKFDYFVEERVEAGLALQGWEVKSLRAGRIQLQDSYVIVKDGEAWLLGALITPLATASTHLYADPTRTRKLLLHRHELHHMFGAIERRGYTVIPLAMYWKRGRAKLEVAIAKGKQSHDKRQTIKERDWQREKQRMFKANK